MSPGFDSRLEHNFLFVPVDNNRIRPTSFFLIFSTTLFFNIPSFDVTMTPPPKILIVSSFGSVGRKFQSTLVVVLHRVVWRYRKRQPSGQGRWDAEAHHTLTATEQFSVRVRLCALTRYNRNRRRIVDEKQKQKKRKRGDSDNTLPHTHSFISLSGVVVRFLFSFSPSSSSSRRCRHTISVLVEGRERNCGCHYSQPLNSNRHSKARQGKARQTHTHSLLDSFNSKRTNQRTNQPTDRVSNSQRLPHCFQRNSTTDTEKLTPTATMDVSNNIDSSSLLPTDDTGVWDGE